MCSLPVWRLLPAASVDGLPVAEPGGGGRGMKVTGKLWLVLQTEVTPRDG